EEYSPWTANGFFLAREQNPSFQGCLSFLFFVAAQQRTAHVLSGCHSYPAKLLGKPGMRH
ncbi:hypothetical protein, partial [uncultured Desulfovibrio sp.]|uniref:hypothetical protein n=1 Tax=uncultured Desulfovibrio sp. TaxID=167968 RepID=UPI0026DB675D